MSQVLREALKQFVLVTTGIVPWRQSLQLLPYARGKSLIDNIVCPMSNDTRSSRIFVEGPIIESIYLAIEFRGKRLNPRSQFLSNEFLQNSRQRISGSNILVSSCLVNECD